MKIVETAAHVLKGATVAVAVVTALPIAGPVGTITAAGAAVASVAGAVCGYIDSEK